MLGTLSVTKEVTPQEYNISVLTIWKNDRAITDWANGIYADLELQRLQYINYARMISADYAKLRRAAVSLEALTDLVTSYKELKRLSENIPS